MSSEDLLGQLRAYALSTGNSTIDMNLFLRTLPRERFGEIESGVKELAFKGAFTLDAPDGKPAFISFPDFPVLALVDEYRKLAQDAMRPFPREETAPVPVPPEDVLALDAKGQLAELFNAEAVSSPPVIKLLFPEGVPSLIVPRACSRAELIDAAIARISLYLQEIKNAQYAESKLTALLRGSEGSGRQALDDITLRPRKAASSILGPTEFSFRFWNAMASLIVQDTGRKTELTDVDTGLLQSAHIVTYTVFHMKGEAQRELERAADRKALEVQVRRAPFVFTYQDLYDLRDEKGAPYSLKHSRDFIHEFLTESLQKKDEATLPTLLRLFHAPSSRDYFVHRDMLVPVFLKKLTDAADTLRVEYVKEWVDQMRQDRTPPATLSDAAFRKEVESRIRDGFPALAALANGPILLAVLGNAPLDDETETEMSRCFTSTSALRPMTVLLGLSRVRLLREARSYLPFWQTAPVIRGIARLLRMLFRGRDDSGNRQARPGVRDRRTAPGASAGAGASGSGAAAAGAGAPAGASAAASSAGASAGSTASAALSPLSTSPTSEAAKAAAERLALQRYQRNIRALISSLVPPEKKPDVVLADLIEKWNPLLEPGPKQDLVRDVNALVHDFIRPIRRDFIARPPDLARVTLLAEQLSASRSLAKIGNRDPLVRYIQLYMLRALLG